MVRCGAPLTFGVAYDFTPRTNIQFCNFGSVNNRCGCRILDDHTSVSGVQSQALDSIKDKLNDAELALQHEKHARAQNESYVLKKNN